MNLMQGAPPSPDRQVTVADWRAPGVCRWSFSHVRQLLPTAPMPPATTPTRLPEARQDLSGVPVADDGTSLAGYLEANATDAFVVLQRGQLVHEWYGGWGAADRQHIIFSISKSLTALLVGNLVGAGVLDPDRPVTHYLPETKGSAYEGATLRHVLDMTVASAFSEEYLDEDGIFMAYRRAAAWNPPEEGGSSEGLRRFLARLPASDGAHGDRFHYCSPHSDLLGWIVERAAGDSFAALMSHRLMQPSGLAAEGYITLDTYGAPRVAGGVCVTAPDLARLGELVRCGGAVGAQQVVPESWIADLRTHDTRAAWQAQSDGPRHFPDGCYRSKWYQTGLPDDEFCGIGIHGQWLWINPAREVVIVHLASQDAPTDPDNRPGLIEMLRATARALG
ncbi:MAG: serine hydrolase domain-containing protein [Candidatus Puniceispirillaceae bacterium]